MIIPEFLYQFTRPKDVAQQHMQVVQRSITTQTASSSINLTGYRNATDNIFVCINAHAQIFTPPTAFPAQNPISGYLSVTGQNTGLERFYGKYSVDTFGPNVQRVVEMNWTGELWVMPGSSVGANGTFSGSTAGANGLTLYLQGFLIPRGNVTWG